MAGVGQQAPASRGGAVPSSSGLFPIPTPAATPAASKHEVLEWTACGKSYEEAATEQEREEERQRARKRKLKELEELEQKLARREEKKRKKKEEKARKRERKRRKREIKKFGAPLIQGLNDLSPKMTGREVIVIGRIVEGEQALVTNGALLGIESACALVEAKHNDADKPGVEVDPSDEGEEEEGERSIDAIARRKARKTLEKALIDRSTVNEEERMKRRDEEERRRRQAECWRTLPHLSKDQERFRLKNDSKDIIVQFDPEQKDTFLPDHTDVWVWGKLEVRIIPLQELCTVPEMAYGMPLDMQIPIFVVHLRKWKATDDLSDKSP